MLQNVCLLYSYCTNLEVPFSNLSPYRLLDLFVIAPRCTQDALRRFYNWQSTRLSCLFLTVPPTIPRSPFHSPFLCLALSLPCFSSHVICPLSPLLSFITPPPCALGESHHHIVTFTWGDWCVWYLLPRHRTIKKISRWQQKLCLST